MSGYNYNHPKARIFFVLCLAGLPCIPALSAEPVSFDDYAAMPLADLLNLPITSSTLTEKNTRSVPSSVTVFTREQIRRLGINYLHELINYVPGFQSFRQEESSDEYYHSARGHRSSTASREILILIDGQRFNREFDNAIAAPMISLGNIEKIEFIRGPGSALYGSNAFLGTINITTIKNTNEALLSYGSNKNAQAQGLFNTQIDTLNLDLFVNAFDDQGQSYALEDVTTHTDYPSRDPYQGYDVNLKLGWQEKQFNLMHFERQANEFYVLGINSNTLNQTRNEYTSLQFQDTAHWADKLKSNYALRYYEDHYQPESSLLGDSTIHQQSESAEFKLDNDWLISDNQTFQFGLEYRHSKIDEVLFKTSLLGPDLLYPETNRDVSGIYVQHQSNLLATTQLTVGARYDDYSQIGSALSPRLGLVHQLTQVHTLKLLYAEAFRAPSTNELILQDVFGAANLVGNPALKPEIVKTWEAIWLGNWQNHSVGLTIFNNHISDVIALDESATPDTFVNASGDEYSHGIEMEYIGELSPSWRWRTSYTYMENLSSDDFRQADNLASLILNYRNPLWNANVSMNYAGERETLTPGGLQTLDDYWLVNAKLQRHFNPELSLYLQIKNILDEAYETPARSATFNTGLPNRGRELSTGIDWKF